MYTVVHNDCDVLDEAIPKDAVLCGFNNKHYDQYILKAALSGATPEEIKSLNDFIILQGGNGWEHPLMQERVRWIDQFDLFDDCQAGVSLKMNEAHLGMDIRESTVDFSITHNLSPTELSEVISYCKHDVDATERLYHLRKDYLQNKIFLGRVKGISDERALYLTNAKLTAVYLGADAKTHNDERNYVYPANLLRQYIPQEAFDFFGRLTDKSIPDKEVFEGKLTLSIGECEVTLGFGGIHGAIPTYRERETTERVIRNQDVGSYYPHLMVINGYVSRSIQNPNDFAQILKRRMEAKRSGDKPLANALKLVANTTYGAMLDKYNALYDPLMGRSVCISGQLYLLELAMHLTHKCSTLRIIQLNTDGLMCSLDKTELDVYEEICTEWQRRTGFTLEEDHIHEIIQKDVNNYIEVATNGDKKLKGGMLVRGIAKAGAFNVNNNAPIVSESIVKYFTEGIPVEDTINACTDLSKFQLIAKASHKYEAVYHIVNDEYMPVQKCNRVYAVDDYRCGTLIKQHKNGTLAKIAGLPTWCRLDNANVGGIADLDRIWYINLAKKQVDAFLGVKSRIRNRRAVNKKVRDILKTLEVNE